MVKRLERLLWPRAWRDGLLGGSQAWTAVFVVIGGVRVIRWLSRPGDGVVYREELRPGESLTISHLPGR
jgi:hypothetical protein